MNRLIDQDTRFWEVFDENKISLGVFMYGDLMQNFTPGIGYGILATALTVLKSKNYSWKVIGDICPLEEDSDNPIIQAKKIEYRKREKERDKKQAKKHGFKLDSVIKFGKHKGCTIKQLIHNHPSYWNWLIENKILLLHPEVQNYTK